MGGLLLLLLIVWIGLLLSGRSKLSARLDHLESRFRDLEDRLGEASPTDARPFPTTLTVSPEPSPPHSAPLGPARDQQRPSAAKRLWRQVERLFIENWTGILGVVVVVAGVTFVAINLALRLDAFHRFLLTVAAAVGLCVPSLVLASREPWRNLSQWMRSGGVALFLFACAGAGGLPELGLQWIQDPLWALGLLVLGMAANLGVASCARTQTIASLHVVLSLVPLLIVAQGPLTLVLASVIALVGLLLPGRREWDRHRLIVLWSYGLYQGSWFVRSLAALPAATPLAPDLRVLAATAALVVFGSVILGLHRPRAIAASLSAARLGLLLSGWSGLILALLAYPTTAAGRATALAIAGGASLLLRRQAHAYGVRWLVLSDTLIAQGCVMAALFSLQPLVADPLLLLTALLIETLLFLALGVREGEGAIQRLGWFLSAAMAGGVLLAGLEAAVTSDASPWQNASVLIGAAALLAWAQILIRRHAVTVPVPPLLGWLSGALAFVGTSLCTPEPWREAGALLALGGLLLAARTAPPPGLTTGTGSAIVVSHLVSWTTLLASDTSALPVIILVARLAPLAALSLLMIASSGRRPQRPLGIDLLGIQAGLGAFLLFEPLSPLIPGVAWLVLSLIALELANRLRRADATHVLLLGLGFLGAFALAYLLVISQSPAYLALGPLAISTRLLIELFGLAVVLQWWFHHPSALLGSHPVWLRLHPCLLEAALLGTGVIVLQEVTTLWRPVAWSLLALVLLSEPMRRLFATRLQVYAVLFFWVAIATVVGMLGTLETPSARWFQQPHSIGLLAIGLQVAFILASHRLLDPERLRAPGGWPILRWIGAAVANRPHRWIYYPMFAAVAYYLAIRYDRALLTLLWAAEAFVVYLLSAVLRDHQFRTVALIALGVTLFRLVVIDMEQADLGVRGLVFIGVGVLMLAMNAIYNRFRNRFQ